MELPTKAHGANYGSGRYGRVGVQTGARAIVLADDKTITGGYYLQEAQRPEKRTPGATDWKSGIVEPRGA